MGPYDEKDGVSERNHNISVFYTSASPRAIESEQATEALWPYVIPMEKSGIAEWTRYNCLLRNSLNMSLVLEIYGILY